MLAITPNESAIRDDIGCLRLMPLSAIKRCLFAGLLVVSIWSAACARKAPPIPGMPVVYVSPPIQRDISVCSNQIGATVGLGDPNSLSGNWIPSVVEL